ncbi:MULTISPECIES: Uma2 family endonuclease [Spirulina sp. CCY15215]|uniref:Uma2 family endonuclease n=1 Tax=Spirulina sp. CCY15215 TaxID=2767591 RepID=UPI001950CD2A
MTLTAYKWTSDRYHQAIDAGLFVDQSLELLRGELIVMPPEREPHAYYNSESGDYLRHILATQAKVREAHPVTLPDHSEPIPDLAIVKPLGIVYRDRHPHPEDIFWIVEVSNTTLNRDLTVKKDIYAEAGILEYWVINLRDRELTIFRDLENKTYTTVQVATTGMISPLAFPDLQISIQRLTNP